MAGYGSSKNTAILSKLYLDENTGVLLDLGSGLSILLSIILIITFKKIKKHIKELGELDAWTNIDSSCYNICNKFWLCGDCKWIKIY